MSSQASPPVNASTMLSPTLMYMSPSMWAVALIRLFDALRRQAKTLTLSWEKKKQVGPV